MSDKKLYASITGTSSPLTVSVSQNHDSAVATAQITCIDTNLDVGDAIAIDIGYTTNHGQVFNGYVKRVEKNTPEGLYTIVANDRLVRAVDYFIVSSTPDNPLTYNNISAENLVRSVLQEAGLSNFDMGTTYFTFGINNPVEVNLVSSYDYARMICDIIAWSFWCEQDGTIMMRNRKPHPMFHEEDGGIPGEDQQPGWTEDSTIGTIDDTGLMSINYGWHEVDLRNKAVVYGNENISAEAHSATSYDPATGEMRQILPSGFYKAMVLSSPLIESQGFAQNACNYNLQLYNKLTYEVPATIEGEHSLEARKVITVDSASGVISGDWYIYQLEHSWSKSGYLTNMVLRK